MQSGMYWGYVSLIEGLVARIKAEYGKPMTVIATGGLASIFQRQVAVIDHVDPDLTIRGLMLIHARNQAKENPVPPQAEPRIERYCIGMADTSNTTNDLVFLP